MIYDIRLVNRLRTAARRLQGRLRTFPVVLITGPRHSGKTALALSALKEGYVIYRGRRDFNAGRGLRLVSWEGLAGGGLPWGRA